MSSRSGRLLVVTHPKCSLNPARSAGIPTRVEPKKLMRPGTVTCASQYKDDQLRCGLPRSTALPESVLDGPSANAFDPSSTFSDSGSLRPASFDFRLGS